MKQIRSPFEGTMMMMMIMKMQIFESFAAAGGKFFISPLTGNMRII